MCVLCPQEWHHGRSIWYFILDCFGSVLSDGIAGIAEFGWMDILAVMAHVRTKASQQLVLVVSATVHSAFSFSFRQSSTTHSTATHSDSPFCVCVCKPNFIEFVLVVYWSEK